jgi:hypothetical protein
MPYKHGNSFHGSVVKSSDKYDKSLAGLRSQHKERLKLIHNKQKGVCIKCLKPISPQNFFCSRYCQNIIKYSFSDLYKQLEIEEDEY